MATVVSNNCNCSASGTLRIGVLPLKRSRISTPARIRTRKGALRFLRRWESAQHALTSCHVITLGDARPGLPTCSAPLLILQRAAPTWPPHAFASTCSPDPFASSHTRCRGGAPIDGTPPPPPSPLLLQLFSFSVRSCAGGMFLSRACRAARGWA